MGSNAHIRSASAPIAEPSSVTNARLYGYRADRLDAILDSMNGLGMARYLGLYGGGAPDDRHDGQKDDRLRYLPDARR
jgi:hypothetical protein